MADLKKTESSLCVLMQIDLHNVLNATNKGITSNFCLNVYNKSLAGAHTIVTAGGGRGAK